MCCCILLAVPTILDSAGWVRLKDEIIDIFHLNITSQYPSSDSKTFHIKFLSNIGF